MPNDITTVQRDQLRNPKYLEAYLRDHYRTGPEEFRIALREAVLSQDGGFAGLSRRTGLARTGLYKALSASGNPSYYTVMPSARRVRGKHRCCRESASGEETENDGTDESPCVPPCAARSRHNG